MSHENILKGFKVMICTKFYNLGRLWKITHEPSKLELSFLHATLQPNALYNLTKFHEIAQRVKELLAADGRTDGKTDGQKDRHMPT